MESFAKSGEQKKAEAGVEAFRRELGPFVVAAEKTRMPMIFMDAQAPDHPIIFANAAFLKLTGYDRQEVLGRKFRSLLADGMHNGDVSAVNAEFVKDDGSELEIRYKRKNGTEFWASVFVSPVCDDRGSVVQHFASFVDLTQHKEDNARCKRMIDELNHRVKNTLSTVQSVVTQVLRRPAEPSEMREAIESRLLALSRSHDLLTTSHWHGAGLRDLVALAMEPFEVAGRLERFTIRGADVKLPPQTTLSLAIGLHELATNAAKYGAFSNDVGTIAISWVTSPASGGDRLVLSWVEEGGPQVVPPTHNGFGTWVIERGLAHELGGLVSLDYLPGGVTCTIDIPAPHVSRI